MSNFFQGIWDNAIGGVLRKPLKQATGLSDLQLAGLTAAAVAAPYAIGASGAAGAGSTATGGMGGFFEGLMGSGAAAGAPAAPAAEAGGMSSYLGTAGKLATIGSQTGLLNQQHQPIQGAQLNRQAPQFAGLLTQPQDNDAQRRQQYQQYVQGLLGGSYGRSA